jgi:hypothetical protein
MSRDDAPQTVAVLPPGAAGCMGALVDGPGKLIGRVNAICRGCLRYQDRKHADRLMPTPNINVGGAYYCASRIGA